MGSLVKTDKNRLISIRHSDPGSELSKPFENEIYLLTTNIAGTRHIEGIWELSESLKTDEKLDLFREPDNEADERAIVIRTANGIKVGYIPRHDNAVLSRLMDAGKLLYGRIDRIDNLPCAQTVNIDIKVYLKD